MGGDLQPDPINMQTYDDNFQEQKAAHAHKRLI